MFGYIKIRKTTNHKNNKYISKKGKVAPSIYNIYVAYMSPETRHVGGSSGYNVGFAETLVF